MVLQVLKDVGLLGPDQQLPASVRVKNGTNRFGKAIHYYFNYSNDEQSFSYSYGNGTELTQQRHVARGETLKLAPWDVAILEED